MDEWYFLGGDSLEVFGTLTYTIMNKNKKEEKSLVINRHAGIMIPRLKLSKGNWKEMGNSMFCILGCESSLVHKSNCALSEAGHLTAATDFQFPILG